MTTNAPDDDLARRVGQARDALQLHAGTEIRTEIASADRVAERLQTTREPYLSGFGWSLSAAPGGTAMGRVSVGFPQPDAVPRESGIFVHVWIGAAVGQPVVAELSGVDARFPRLTQPKVPGLLPGTTQVPQFPIPPDMALLDFRLRVPFDVEPSVYLGNVALVRRAPFSAGELLDRTTFAFRVREVDEPPDLNPSA
jgi:hypothetical protein